MAARYVNPDNITAQGQYFYTGLPPGSYDSQGGRGAANVYGAGSGGSAGVSPDYTGADAGKSWQYPASFEIKLPIWDKDFGNPLAGTGGGGGKGGKRGKGKGKGKGRKKRKKWQEDESGNNTWNDDQWNGGYWTGKKKKRKYKKKGKNRA